MPNFEPTPEFEQHLRAALRPSDADPEFVAHLRERLARLPRPQPQPRPRVVLRPAWALSVALLLGLVLLAGSPRVVRAVRQWFRFVPGLGLVEPGEMQRMLPEPLTLTRDGVTLTLDHVLVFPDRVELAYTVTSLPPAPQPAASEPVCSGADMYPRLGLPDGATVPADPMALGGVRQAAGYTAGHSFSTALPAGVNAATFLLTCLADMPRGAAPEDWSLPFTLVAAPAGQPVGQPLSTAALPVVTQVPAHQPETAAIQFAFEGGALHADGYHVFFRFTAQNDHPDFMTVRPHTMYALDATGARIDMIDVLPWSPFDHVDVWEFRLVDTPAPGPLTLVIEDAQVYYLAQAAAFSFTPAADAPLGHTWPLDHRFEIGGHSFVVESARKIEMEGHPGFEFVITPAEPGLQVGAELMDVHSSAAGFELWSTTGALAAGRRITPGFVYTSATPPTVQVTFNTLWAQVTGTWQVDWTPPAQ